MRTLSRSWHGTRNIQRGQAGELAAEAWFRRNGWHMVRTQPAIQILGVQKGKRYGTVFTVRITSRGGTPDYTGYFMEGGKAPIYCACEVKEVSSGDTMPCSRLDKAQREFMGGLPVGCAYVGILWSTGEFKVYPYKKRGSYERVEGLERRTTESRS